MAAVGSETAQGLQQLFIDISLKFSSVESENVVKILKNNYGGKFDLLGNRDLLESLHLLKKHGYVSENNLKLIEDVIAPKSNNEEIIKKFIERFKASRSVTADPEKELLGRSEEIKRINKKLESKDTGVLNLFGSSGIGKTKLANEVCLQWQGIYRVFDLREAKDMRAIYYNMLHSLELVVPVGNVDQNYVVTKILEKVEELEREEHAVLFMLDNADHFTAGKDEEGKNLETTFMELLAKLSESKGKRSPLKLLLTSKTELRGPSNVNNFKVSTLKRVFSEKLIIPEGKTDVKPQQKDDLMSIAKRFPLILKGLGAILRQERKSPVELIVEVARALKKSKVEEDTGERPVSFEEEGVDVNQMSAISLMFETLSTERLKLSAVVISFFRGPFSVQTAAKVLGIDPPEAIIQLEGLVACQIISVVDEEAKERKYDIHSLLQKYANSIKDHENFCAPYLEAKGRFYELFISRMKKIAELIEPDHVKAFHLFETNKGNYEFTIEISLQPEYFRLPGELHESALISSLLIAMLNGKQLIKVFHCWANMCEDDGRSGSLARAQFKSWEASQVADIDGTEKASEVLRSALCSLERVEDKSSDFFKLTKGLYLRVKGEILWRNRDNERALVSLKLALTFSEPLLKEHTDIARCYNAIGNSFFALNQPRKALEFFKKAYKVQKKLASENHFDVPMYKNQIGTAYEGLKDYEKAEKCYRDALSLLEKLELAGYWDEALFQRNLANALMFQKKYEDAIFPSERAYSIRMKLLGKHPQTVHSIYQRGVLQASLGHPNEALQLFLEGWEMEKTLGVGNHSEVWRKIITGVEDMCSWTNKRRKKKSFRREALKFCQYLWEEQKASQQFTFNEFNKDIIEALKDLSSDTADVHFIESEELWFLRGMCKEYKEMSQTLIQTDEFLEAIIRPEAEQSILEWDKGAKDVITKEKEENKTVVESVQEKANRTVVGTGARSDEEMVASSGEDLGGGNKKTGVSLVETVAEVPQAEGGGVRIPVPTLDTHCILKDSAFEYNKALEERKVELPWQNEEKVSSVVNHSTACKEKWLEISLLCDGWTSRGGGLSTLNRELTVHLAGAGMVRVTVFLPEGACAHEHKKEAEKHGINVVEAKRLLGYDDPQVWLSFPPPDLKPDVVIGHGQKLGRQGQIFKCLPHRCKWIQMVHTDPKELSKYKIDSQAVCKGEEKHKTEVGLCKMAHLVVNVGPKLYDAFSNYLGNEYVSNILKLTPGLFEEFKDLNHALREGSNFKVLLCGRSDPEDFKLKGFDIAAKAFACIELREPSYLLIFVGALKGKKQEMKGKLLEFGIREDQLFVKEFVESREEMKKLLCEVDLVIMPSRAEGFGLVALEALSAGLPVLVGKNSGLAQAIRDLPNGKLCIVDSEEPQEWATAITTVQQGHNEYLQKIKDLREAYGKKYSWEEQCEVLVDKMREMILHAN